MSEQEKQIAQLINTIKGFLISGDDWIFLRMWRRTLW